MKTISLVLIILLKSPVFAVPDNIAPLAKVSTSSCVSVAYSATNVTDNCIHMEHYVEWASNSRITFWGQIDFPWIELKWDETRVISKIVLFDRPGLETHLAGGRTIEAMIKTGHLDLAYHEISPFLDRVIKNNGFYEWYSVLDHQPHGFNTILGAAGALGIVVR